MLSVQEETKSGLLSIYWCVACKRNKVCVSEIYLTEELKRWEVPGVQKGGGVEKHRIGGPPCTVQA